MKIFCIGFAKTGTTSLSVALMHLGYNVKGTIGIHDINISKIIYKLIDKTVPLYDAFQDNPWPIVYEYLDKNYDGMFILTMRDEKGWIKSLLNHCGKNETPFRKWIYGYANPIGHEQVYIDRYNKHNKEVREYFKGKSNFLELNIINGEGWEKLCPFLGYEIKNIKFPHENKGK